MITSVTIGNSLEKIKYPWKYCLMSALEVADTAIMVLGGPHQDDTVNRVLEFAADNKRVKVVYGKHDRQNVEAFLSKTAVANVEYHPDANWPSHHWGLGDLTNLGLDFVETSWAFQLQADEILDETSCREMLSVPDCESVTFAFRHYCGTPYYTFPFMYERVVRMGKTRTAMALGDAAEWARVGRVYDSNILIHHVGKIHVGRQEAAAWKEFRFQDDLYKGKAIGDVDPKIVEARNEGKLDFFKVFESTIKRGDVKEFAGDWPKYMKMWCSEELGVEL